MTDTKGLLFFLALYVTMYLGSSKHLLVEVEDSNKDYAFNKESNNGKVDTIKNSENTNIKKGKNKPRNRGANDYEMNDLEDELMGRKELKVNYIDNIQITTTDTITTPPEEVSTTTSPPTTITTNETLKMSETNDYGAGNTGEKECRIHHECDLGNLCTKDWKCEMIFCKKTEDCKAKVALPTECTKWGLCDGNTYCKSNAECKEAGQEYVCENNSGHCKPQYGECHMTKDCLEMGMEKGEALCTQTGTFEEKAKVCLCRSDSIAVCGKN